MEVTGMKVLVYGAGVIGCYLTHVLCQAGHDVTLLARGNWKSVLETKGLTIRHHLQRRTTTDHPHIIGHIDTSQHYDVVFSVMSYHQVNAILDELVAVDADTVVLVGNNLSAPDMERYLKTHSNRKKNILFGFQVTAGKRESEYAICERAGSGTMDIGFLHTAASESLRRTMERLVHNTGYRLRWHDDMESFFKCHVAAILPLGYLAYGADCDYKKTTKKQRRLCLDASIEGYDLLLRLGYSVVPKGDDAYFRPGPKRWIMQFVYYVMSKTVFGELMAAAHCRHAVSEMESLDKAWSDLRSQALDFPMPNWDALRSAMPDWETLHRTYDGRRETLARNSE
jgi:2-dehydropantoate 2-reductase